MKEDKTIPAEFEKVFSRLKLILQRHADGFVIKPDTKNSYGLQGKPGAAAIKAWGGKLKKPVMPVGWIETGKAYVSFHLMGMYANMALQNSMSKELIARMQGKTCFNFKNINEALFEELEKVTIRSIEDFRSQGFVV